uniref:DUF2655 domain-containing protein n=1 Tax=Ascaris lumbricoides TaxID=6252 RepID=A0A0M3HMH8_ASCLU
MRLSVNQATILSANRGLSLRFIQMFNSAQYTTRLLDCHEDDSFVLSDVDTLEIARRLNHKLIIGVHECANICRNCSMKPFSRKTHLHWQACCLADECAGGLFVYVPLTVYWALIVRIIVTSLDTIINRRASSVPTT